MVPVVVAGFLLLARALRRSAGGAPPRDDAPDLRDMLSEAAGLAGYVPDGDEWRHPAGLIARIDRSSIVIEGLPELRMRAAGLFSRGGPPTGDELFDKQIWVRGPEPATRSRLSAEVRAAARALFALAPQARISGGRLVLAGRAMPSFAVGGALRLAALLGSGDMVERLAEIAAADPHPRVRREALRSLIAGFGSHPRTASAILAASGDPDVEVRLEALLRRLAEGGARGEEVGEALKRIAEDAAAPVSARTDALRGASGLPKHRRLEMLYRALTFRVPGLRIAALSVVEGLRWPELLPPLGRLAESLAGSRVADDAAVLRSLVSAARAYEREGEPVLARVLECGVAAARIAAVDALGEFGTVASVGRLRAMASGGLSVPRDELRAAAIAIEKIQARAVGADEGQLSVSAPGGELSPAAERGTLALPRAGSR